MLRYLVPLGVFAMLVAVLAIGLNRNPRLIPSPLIGKPAPQFSLPQLAHPKRMLSRKDLLGKVTLFNVWASWCVSCRDEASVLDALSKRKIVPIYGLNYKDQRASALEWLKVFGNPYVVNAFDHKGNVAINWGVYGVPETFVVDAKGIIRYKQIGPVTPEVLRNKILPLVRRLQREARG